MSKEHLSIKTLVSAILAVSVISGTSVSVAAEKPSAEKCYGISKKGMNDCAGNNHTCQGQSLKDGDAKEFLYVLEGTCQKIVGGSKAK